MPTIIITSYVPKNIRIEAAGTKLLCKICNWKYSRMLLLACAMRPDGPGRSFCMAKNKETKMFRKDEKVFKEKE